MMHYILARCTAKGLELKLTGLFSLVGWLGLPSTALAQNNIVPDDTLGNEPSVVVPANTNVDLIVGGAQREQNLFHSFEEFNINVGQTAFFATNSDIIANIFARVTGGNPSEILGRLGTVQLTPGGPVPTSADLFLINPNGILFGENMLLDVGGSFTASTASGVQFDQLGNFSASVPVVPIPLLTINPSAYLFSGSNPGDINASFAQFLVPEGEALSLLGGNLTLNSTTISANGGTIQLAAVIDEGTVEVEDNLSLVIPADISHGNVVLDQESFISSVAEDGGEVIISAEDVNIANNSLIGVGLAAGNPSTTGQVGDITVQATGNIRISESLVANQSFPGSIGNSGAIRISAENVEITNGAQISSSTFGSGNSGDIAINALEAVSIDGVNSDTGNNSAILSNAARGSVGDGGSVMITATNLNLTNGAQINTSNFGEGQSGNATFNISEALLLDGIVESNNRPIASSIITFLGRGASGRGGDINISAGNLRVVDGAFLSASTFGIGNSGGISVNVAESAIFSGGDLFSGGVSGLSSVVNPGAIGEGGSIFLSARTLEVTDGARLDTSTFGEGNAGNIFIEILDTAVIDGFNTLSNSRSLVSSDVEPSGIGNGGNIYLSSRQLDVTNGALLGSAIFGQGNAGDIVLEVANLARFDGASSSMNSSGIVNAIQQGGTGTGGDISIIASNVEVTNGAQLNTATFGEGNAGDIQLQIFNNVKIDGFYEGDGSLISLIGSGVEENAVGQGGDIQINSNNLDVTNGGQISTSMFGVGDAGNITLNIADTAFFEGLNPLLQNVPSSAVGSVQPGSNGNGGVVIVTANHLRLNNQAQIGAFTFEEGNAGDVFVKVNDLTVTNGAQISSATQSSGDAGNIIIEVAETAHFEGVSPFNDDVPSGAINGSLGNGEINGRGGDIRLSAANLEISNRALLSSASRNTGNAGNIVVNIQEEYFAQDGTIETTAERASGGQINITAGNIVLEGDSDIQTFVSSGEGGGGNITIVADSVIAFDDSDILAFAADGRGGNIDLSRTIFFGDGFEISPPGTDPATLDGNDRVDINASGGLAEGTILLPDTSFVENSLSNLPDAVVSPDALLAGSCIVQSGNTQGSFVVTGGDDLPTRPGNPALSAFPTDTARTIDSPSAETSTEGWQPGDPIVEPTDVFELADGRLVLSQICE